MSRHETCRWVVCYDIADRKRLLRVHRITKKHGLPLQYSVFMVEASVPQLLQLLTQLRSVIVPAVDDVRAYLWTVDAEVHVLGRGILPDGLLLPDPGATAPQAADAAARSVRRVTARVASATASACGDEENSTVESGPVP